jgi:hypothetical protein
MPSVCPSPHLRSPQHRHLQNEIARYKSEASEAAEALKNAKEGAAGAAEESEQVSKLTKVCTAVSSSHIGTSDERIDAEPLAQRCADILSLSPLTAKELQAKKMDEEALLAEMEVTGQAFDSLQEQNGMFDDGYGPLLARRPFRVIRSLARFVIFTARLIQQLKSKEAASLQLMQDTAKGSQRERMLKV